MFERRIFISLVDDGFLSPAEIDFKWAIVDHIENNLPYQVEIFYNPRTTKGIAARNYGPPPMPRM